ncbi:MAG TPA: hypothetical protein VMU77_02685 [Acidimicrobiales bacterium]|nr:hypothetical protein [Acidimicrobiales bacterium]
MRTGLVTGAALGYYLGAKAGRGRYEQMSKVLRRTARSNAFKTGVGKARALVNLGVERSKDLIGSQEDKAPGIRITKSNGVASERSGANVHVANTPGNVVYLGESTTRTASERRYF